jgi:hypothetical protein
MAAAVQSNSPASSANLVRKLALTLSPQLISNEQITAGSPRTEEGADVMDEVQ